MAESMVGTIDIVGKLGSWDITIRIDEKGQRHYGVCHLVDEDPSRPCPTLDDIRAVLGVDYEQ